MESIVRATRALIRLDALASNLKIIRETIPPGTLICAAVKANAYGHGSVPVSRALRAAGTEILGVATPFEGLELRDSGDPGRIILFGPTVPEEIPVTIETNLEPMVTGREYLNDLLTALAAHSSPRRLSVHLKIDTGMGRVGCTPDQAPILARLIHESSNLELAGLATHFPVADSWEPADIEFTRSQAAALDALAKQIRADGIEPGLVHAANSGAVAISPETSRGMVRPGIALYGYGAEVPHRRWTPVMEIRSRITAIKKVSAGDTVSYGRTWTAKEETHIATIPVGYADGYPPTSLKSEPGFNWRANLSGGRTGLHGSDDGEPGSADGCRSL
jgi:alanine racemase